MRIPPPVLNSLITTLRSIRLEEAAPDGPARPRLRDRQHGPEGPAGRQGCEPRRDDPARHPGTAGLHHHHGRLPGLPRLAARCPPELFDEVDEHLERLEARMGRTLGDGDDPLLVSVRSGAKFSMPGMMETVLNIGLGDTSVEGLARQTGNPRFAWDSYRRLVQMYGKTVLDLHGDRFEDALDAAKAAKGVTLDVDLDADDLRALVATFKADRRGGDRLAVPAGPARSAARRGARRLQLVELRPRDPLPPPRADPHRPRHRRQRAGDGLRQPRRVLGLRRRLHPRPVDRGHRRLRRLPAGRAGRGRRRRHPQHPAPRRPRGHRQEELRRARRHHGPPREPLPRHVRHRVHHRAGPPVDAADPGGQAHRAGRLPHRGRPRRRGRHHRGGGPDAGHR